MGVLDWLRRRPLAASTALVEARPSVVTETVGVSGTANYSGRLQVERNQALRDQAGYGRAGSLQWGEWEEIRRANPWVAAAVEFALAPIQDARLDVKPSETHPQPELAAKQAAFVEWNLKLLEPVLRSRAADGMLTSGFSLFEHGWSTTTRPEIQGKAFFVPALEERLPSSLASAPWLEDDDGNLVAVRQSAPVPGGGWFDGELPAERLVRFTHNQTGRNYAGFSAFRPVWYIAGRVQPELLRLIGVTYQREGAGVPVAYAADEKAALTAEQRIQLQELMANLVYHENANAVLPAGWRIDWVFSGGANKGHILEAWKQLGIVVLQQTGAQQLALGTGETGSRSVGEVHSAHSQVFPRKVAKTLNDGIAVLVKRIVDANWGPQESYPEAKLTLQRPELAPLERVEALATAKGAGLITITDADENHLREELGMPPITPEERAAEKAAPAPTPTLPPGAPVPPNAPPAPIQAHTERCGCGDCPTLTATAATWQPWRALRASEKKTPFEAIDAYLAGRREAFERVVKPIVVTMLARAQSAITEAMKDGDPSEVATLPLDTAELDAAVAKYLEDVRKAGGDFARVELRKDAGEKLAEERRDVLSAASEEEQDDKSPAADEAETDTDELVDAQRVALVRRMTSRLRSELETEALDVVRTGGDALEVLTRVVTRQLETGAFRADAGAVVARIFNGGRDEAARIVGGVQAVEYSSILDSRVCSACRGMDGRRASFGSAQHDAMVPPNRDCDGGPNCRCLLVFIPDGGDE